MQFLKRFSVEETKNLASLLLKIVVVDVVCYLTARLGLKMAYGQINTSPV